MLVLKIYKKKDNYYAIYGEKEVLAYGFGESFPFQDPILLTEEHLVIIRKFEENLWRLSHNDNMDHAHVNTTTEIRMNRGKVYSASIEDLSEFQITFPSKGYISGIIYQGIKGTSADKK
jgi:hypothetical protein